MPSHVTGWEKWTSNRLEPATEPLVRVVIGGIVVMGAAVGIGSVVVMVWGVKRMAILLQSVWPLMSAYWIEFGPVWAVESTGSHDWVPGDHRTMAPSRSDGATRVTGSAKVRVYSAAPSLVTETSDWVVSGKRTGRSSARPSLICQDVWRSGGEGVGEAGDVAAPHLSDDGLADDGLADESESSDRHCDASGDDDRAGERQGDVGGAGAGDDDADAGGGGELSAAELAAVDAVYLGSGI
jgi:hypothetical protein